jgi:predicted nucleic acid-binding Zn ribbon protein
MNEEKTKFCPRCGTMIPYQEAFCPLCGEEQPRLLGMPRKSSRRTWIAVVLSLLVTGLGHVYLGEWRRGLGFFGLVFLFSLLASGYMSYDQMIIIGAIVAVAAAVDAYYLSKKRRQ